VFGSIHINDRFRFYCHITYHAHEITDAVSGWLKLASFYYQMKQYNTALYIISYALSKCTPEKEYYERSVSDWQYELIKTRTVQSLGITIILLPDIK
jgi:hypothetical protein